MNGVVQYGVPTRPPWARSWFERVQLRLHLTPKHMSEVMVSEEAIISKAKSILDLLSVVHSDCTVEIHWPERVVKIFHGKECVGDVSFDTLLNQAEGVKFITDHVLSCIKR